MSQRYLLRIMTAGFVLVLCLVLAAAYMGYNGSTAIQVKVRELLREPAIANNRNTVIEAAILKQSEELTDELELALGASLFAAAVCAAVTLWITSRAFKRLEWQSEELNRVSWQMLQGQELVARRFSHEMHDELGQSLTGLRAMLKRLDGAEFTKKRNDCVVVLDEVLTNVRELSQLLRPVILDDFGLDAGLRWLSERFAERTQVEVDYQSDYGERLPEETETHLFRITQEALTNVARHSGATRASVRLETANGRVRLTVEDNGSGLAVTRNGPVKPSLGMVGMRARARRIGGELDASNGVEGGLRLTVEAPIHHANVVREEDTNLVG